MTVPEGYTLRLAGAGDAPTIAVHRAAMWQSIVDGEGRPGPPDFAPFIAVWTPWLERALASGEYLGWLAERRSAVVAGVGLMFHPRMPTPNDPASHQAHLLNVYTEPEHRGSGLARHLLTAALAEAQARGVLAANLNATAAGRPLYERLGFALAGSPEMRLNLAAVTQ